MELVSSYVQAVDQHIMAFLVILILVAFAYYAVLRRHFYSLFDPFTIAVIANIFCTAVVAFMGYCNLCGSYFLLNYLVTEICFLLGIRSIKPVRLFQREKAGYCCSRIEKSADSCFFFILFVCLSALFTSASLLYYYRYGIPLFAAGSRLTDQKNAGAVHSLIDGCQMVLPILLIDGLYRWKDQKKPVRIGYAGVSAFYVLTLLLGGSKSAVLSLIETITLVFLFTLKSGIGKSAWKKANRILLIAAAAAVVVAVAVAWIRIRIDYSASASRPGLFQYIFTRLISYGDAYIYYYTSPVRFDGGTVGNGLLLIFSPVLLIIKNAAGIGGIHLFGNFPQTIGLTMYQTVNHSTIIGGPNSRYNVFGLFYFGFLGSMVFSYLVGLAISAARHLLYRKLKFTRVNLLAYVLLVELAIVNVTDITLSMYYLKVAVIVLLITVAVSAGIRMLVSVIRRRLPPKPQAE